MLEILNELALPTIGGKSLACFFGGGHAPKQKPPPAVKIPPPPKYKMPDVPAPTPPPDIVPPPQQTVTGDTEQAAEDTRRQALRKRGLASGATIFSGAGGYGSGNSLGGTGGQKLG